MYFKSSVAPHHVLASQLVRCRWDCSLGVDFLVPVEMVAVWLRWLMLVASMAEFRLLCLWLTWLWRSSSWTSFMGFSLRCLGSTGIHVPCHPSLQWLFVTLAPDGALSVSVLV